MCNIFIAPRVNASTWYTLEEEIARWCRPFVALWMVSFVDSSTNFAIQLFKDPLFVAGIIMFMHIMYIYLANNRCYLILFFPANQIYLPFLPFIALLHLHSLLWRLVEGRLNAVLRVRVLLYLISEEPLALTFHGRYFHSIISTISAKTVWELDMESETDPSHLKSFQTLRLIISGRLNELCHRLLGFSLTSIRIICKGWIPGDRHLCTVRWRQSRYDYFWYSMLLLRCFWIWFT